MALLGIPVDITTIGDLDAELESPNEAGVDELLELLKLIPECQVFEEPTWIYTIADLVIHGFDYENNGSKLTQIRFYPVDTTQFIR